MIVINDFITLSHRMNYSPSSTRATPRTGRGGGGFGGYGARGAGTAWPAGGHRAGGHRQGGRPGVPGGGSRGLRPLGVGGPRTWGRRAHTDRQQDCRGGSFLPEAHAQELSRTPVANLRSGGLDAPGSRGVKPPRRLRLTPLPARKTVVATTPTGLLPGAFRYLLGGGSARSYAPVPALPLRGHHLRKYAVGQ